MLGPPRCTFTITKGSSAITASPIASAFKAIPGPDDAVTPRFPANAPPIAEVSVTGLDNGFQIVKFTGLNKHLDPDMVEFNIYHSEDSNMSGIKGFAGDSDVYGRIGSVIAFHDKDAMYTVNEGDYFIINSTAAGTDDGMWIMRLYYQRSNSELSEIRLPAL